MFMRGMLIANGFLFALRNYFGVKLLAVLIEKGNQQTRRLASVNEFFIHRRLQGQSVDNAIALLQRDTTEQIRLGVLRFQEIILC
jgi:exopolysaccharide biosynthesis protein